MALIVVPSDRMIMRDGVPHTMPAWPFDDSEIHAIEYIDGKGDKQLKGPPFQNVEFTDIDTVQPYIDYLDACIADGLLVEAVNPVSHLFAD